MRNIRLFSFQQSPVLKSVPAVIDNAKVVLYEKITGLNNWYTSVTGLDKVQECQERVTNLQSRLLEVQDSRRDVATKLTHVRRRSNDLQEQIRNLKRHEEPEKFINLMREDTEVLREETELGKLFLNYDRQERDIFTAYTNAVRDSHEKQKWQLEYTKYLGYTLSIIGSLLAYLYATLYRQNLKYTFESRISETNEAVEEVLNRLGQVETRLFNAFSRHVGNNFEVMQALNPAQKPEMPSKPAGVFNYIDYTNPKQLMGIVIVAYIILRIIN